MEGGGYIYIRAVFAPSIARERGRIREAQRVMALRDGIDCNGILFGCARLGIIRDSGIRERASLLLQTRVVGEMERGVQE